ncbi:MAG: hypothetical protein ABI992_12560 [Chthoniobacterales bacterium]
MEEQRMNTRLLNKVPAVTLIFWIIKIMATTVGETAADFLSVTMKLGLTVTSFVMAGLLLIALGVQFKAKRYTPAIYWIVVVFISVMGTLISDNLVDNLGVSLKTTSIIFGSALIIVFVVWYLSEKTLSVHTIFTNKREAFYWAAILFTFALGTSAGDLIGESLGLGYPLSALMFGGTIAVIYIAYRFLNLNAVLAFWLAYILTRPLGASLGDLLTQPHKAGGFGVSTTIISSIFLVSITLLVIYLSIWREKVSAIELDEA